jgi:cell division protein FtsI/penicillin-binding protein 2
MARSKLVRNVALAVGLGAAAISIAASAGGGGVAADVGGDDLGKSPRITDEVGGASTHTAKKAALKKKLVGDAVLAGELDLTKMELVGDHYEVPMADGRRAILTLDPVLQEAAIKVLGHAKAPYGAVVVTALDGRLLAYAGRRGTGDPKKDPKYAGKEGVADFTLANSAWAPAASVFKIVSASAMVEAGVDPHEQVCYHGGLRSVQESNLVDDKHDDRCNDLAYGLAHSQNAIIAKLANQHLEPAKLASLADTLGFGGDLPAWAMGGQSGLSEIPTEKGVDFAKTAAGFQGTHLSPLGGAMLANTIATGGQKATPTIVAAILDEDGTRHDVSTPKPTRVLPEDTANAVGDMMVQTCDSGSAAKAFRGKDGLPRSIKVAGKTGTLNADSPMALEYSWFVGYAPADAPAISVAVVLGNTDLWWLKGHMAARQMVREALDERTTDK